MQVPKTAMSAKLLLATLLMCFWCVAAQAQPTFPSSDDTSAVSIPDDLSPETVDGLLSRLTDTQIRELLRDELVRRADQQAAEEARPQFLFLMNIQERLSEMANRISTRLVRWTNALTNISDRAPQIRERLSRAQNGVAGMLGSAMLLIVAGVGSALLVAWLINGWRDALLRVDRTRYWEKVVRSIILTVVELIPVGVFIVITQLVAGYIANWLGPLVDQVWIYQTGVSNAWGLIVLARRAFAPRNTHMRIANLHDEAAANLFATIRNAVIIGAAGWVLAGLFPTLGFGFPPALVTVALFGSFVTFYLIAKVLSNTRKIREEVASDVSDDLETRTLGRTLISASPYILVAYLGFAWLYWLAFWLERGQHELAGPLGTLGVLLLLPIVDRFGQELIAAVSKSDSEFAIRVRSVFRNFWTILVIVFAIGYIFSLWAIGILDFAKGDDAPAWAGTIFDIVVTLLIGLFVWRLIAAALHTEKRMSTGGEEDSDEDGASRLDTLTPLFRNVLLGFLFVVITMIVLSDIGIDIGPLIASAGIIGIAVGFGAQTLVRDIFSGIFFLVDDAFRVGEYIELEPGIMGEVEAITVRSIQLRNHRGPVITIPFGEIRQITNHNRDWVIYKMSFRLEPDTDPIKVKKVVKKVGQEFMEHPDHGPKFIEPVKSQGVHSIDDDSALVVRVKFKCKPRAQFVLRREVYHRLRVVFAENDIHFARRKVEVVGADGEAVENPERLALPDDVITKSDVASRVDPQSQ